MTPSTTRLLANTTSKFSSLSIHANRLPIRAFSQTSLRKQDGEYNPLLKPSSLLSKLSTSPPSWQARPPTGQAPRDRARTDGNGGNGEVQHLLATNIMSWARNEPTRSALDNQNTEPTEDWGPAEEPFHFHIYAHKHNTHITVTKPNKNAILSMSTGNIGFKKGKRGSYDAAYQLCAYVLDKLNQGAWHRKINALEVVLRGFGQGREACTKVLLGSEGRLLRPLIRKVSDATRLKFGGTRSKKPRRLG